MEKKKKLITPFTLGLAALSCCGVGAWVYQQAGGLGVTGMNNATSWGLYIACFMLFVGLSAGGLIVASCASLFNIKEYKKVVLPAVLVSTVSICLAGLFVLIDLGRITRVYQIIISPNITSPLFWDICVITIYLILNVVYLVLMTSKEPREQALKIASRFALPAAILVHSVTAWIFGLQIAHEGWYSAIMAPLFVVSAMDSGLALLLIVLLVLNKKGYFKFEINLMAKLVGLLATCIAIDGFMVACEVLTMAYPQAAKGNELLSQMFFGATAPFFWGEIIFGIIVPFAILIFAKNRHNTSFVILSSALVVLGVFCKRIWLLLTSFIYPNVMGAPGMISGSSESAHASGIESWSLLGAYVPTGVEITIVIGVGSLGTLAFILLSKKLLLNRKEAANPSPTNNAAQPI